MDTKQTNKTQFETYLIELHQQFRDWVKTSKHDYCLDSTGTFKDYTIQYVYADTQGAFEVFAAGIVIGMEAADSIEKFRRESKQSDLSR